MLAGDLWRPKAQFTMGQFEMHIWTLLLRILSCSLLVWSNALGQSLGHEKADFQCPEQFGYYPDGNDCGRYFVCVFGGALRESCTGGLYFSVDLQTCDWPRNVKCNAVSGYRSNQTETTTTATPTTTSLSPTSPSGALQSREAPTGRRVPVDAAAQTVVRENGVPAARNLGSSFRTSTSSVATPLEEPAWDDSTESSEGHVVDEDALLAGYTEVYDVPRTKAAKCVGCRTQQQPNANKGEKSFQPGGVRHQVEVATLSDAADIRTQQPSPPTVTVAPQTVIEISTKMSVAVVEEVQTQSSHYDYYDEEEIVDEVSEVQTLVNIHEHGDLTEHFDTVTTTTTATTTSPRTVPIPESPAKRCDPNLCKLPYCFCGGNQLVPGGLPTEEIPQIVLITFDDAVNDINWPLYEQLFYKGRKNPNGCPISATFYVSHEWTDYGKVQTLYSDGHEIASHSITHSYGEDFSKKKWAEEIYGQKEILSTYAGIHMDDIRGMRAPFLQIGGNRQYMMLYESNLTYDSSMPVYENKPPFWPYTLDYAIPHECMIPPCPTLSFPGIWEIPLVMWLDLNGGRCSMADACSNPPTAEGVYKMLVKNFERHYTTNRAPFGLFYHSAWFAIPHHMEGFEAFLDALVRIDDVHVISSRQLIDWMRKPTPLSKIQDFAPWQCNKRDRVPPCKKPKVCNLWFKGGVRYMKTCQPCPTVYPWTNNTGSGNVTSTTNSTSTSTSTTALPAS